MKTFKFLMPFLLVAFVLAGCDTDDLKNDIDELKNRVESLEAQVSVMNDNVNVLKVFVDGNKTIKSWEKTAGGYKIVLSDGSEYNLTQGMEGTVSTPKISISDDGNWVIDGVEQEGKKAVGDNAPVPNFSIKETTIEEEKGSYWYVDMKDGKGEVPVRDQNGNPVKATTSGSVESGDKFFESVKVDDDKMVVKLKDNPKEYSLPIVEGLTCKIVTDGVDGFKDGVLTIGYGQSKELEVEISEAVYMITAPAGWTAVLGEIAEGKATLTVTAPASASAASRATADNTKDLVLQVNKGVNWAIDKIQVKAEYVISSYYSEYQAGKDIVIGDGENSIVINQNKYPNAKLVENDEEITEDGVFFIKEGIKVSFKKGALKNNILIGNNPNVKAECTIAAYLPLNGEGNGFAAKNISFIVAKTLNYIAQTSGNIKYDFFCIDDCSFELPEGKNFVNINRNAEITNVIMVNSKINAANTRYSASRLLNVTGSLSSNGLYVKNNVFYASIDGQAINGTLLFAAGKDIDYPVTVVNNTYVNFLTSSQSLVKGILKQNVTIENNIFWTNTATTYNTTLVMAEDGSTGTQYNLNGNILFNKGANNSLRYFAGTVPSEQQNITIASESSDPFDGGKFDLATGTFVPNSTYADYGAKLD